MAKKMSNEQYLMAIAGCKQSRRVGMCERKCAHWHPMSKAHPSFCKAATTKCKLNSC